MQIGQRMSAGLFMGRASRTSSFQGQEACAACRFPSFLQFFAELLIYHPLFHVDLSFRSGEADNSCLAPVGILKLDISRLKAASACCNPGESLPRARGPGEEAYPGSQTVGCRKFIQSTPAIVAQLAHFSRSNCWERNLSAAGWLEVASRRKSRAAGGDIRP
jgi:hypothetical protein